MEPLVYTRDELIVETHPDGPHMLLGREGKAGTVCISLNEMGCLPAAMCAICPEIAGLAVVDDESGDDQSLSPGA